MKKKQRVSLLLMGPGLLLALWLSYTGAALFLRHNDVPFAVSPPDEVSFLVELNGKELFHEALASTFIAERDEEISDLLLSRTEQLDKQELRLGIDLLNDILIFHDTYKGAPVQGVLLKINNIRLWDRNSPSLSDAHTYCSRIGSTGILLRSAGHDTQQLRTYADERLERKTPVLHASAAQPIGFDLSQPALGWKQIRGGISSRENILQLDAHVVPFGKTVDHRLSQALLPGGFHLTMDVPVSPDSLLNEESRKILTNFGVPISDLNGISMNYFGLTIVNGSTGLLPLPNADLLLSFRNAYMADSLLKRVRQLYPKAEIEPNSFTVDGFKYYVQQISPQVLFLGITKNAAIVERDSGSLLYLRGDLSSFTKVAGGRLMTTMIRMNTEFQLLDDLSGRVEDIRLEIAPYGKGAYRLQGEIRLREGMDATVELIRLLLKSNPKP